jgi:hypothetical protein
MSADDMHTRAGQSPEPDGLIDVDRLVAGAL